MCSPRERTAEYGGLNLADAAELMQRQPIFFPSGMREEIVPEE